MNEFFIKGRYEMVRSWTMGGKYNSKTVDLGFARYVSAASAEEAKEKVVDAVRKKMAVDDRVSKCESFTVTEIKAYERVA